jgi:hypothetical protein
MVHKTAVVAGPQARRHDNWTRAATLARVGSGVVRAAAPLPSGHSSTLTRAEGPLAASYSVALVANRNNNGLRSTRQCKPSRIARNSLKIKSGDEFYSTVSRGVLAASTRQSCRVEMAVTHTKQRIDLLATRQFSEVGAHLDIRIPSFDFRPSLAKLRADRANHKSSRNPHDGLLPTGLAVDYDAARSANRLRCARLGERAPRRAGPARRAGVLPCMGHCPRFGPRTGRRYRNHGTRTPMITKPAVLTQAKSESLN